jgi:hypothetical protein
MVVLGLVGSRIGHSRNGRVRNGRSRIGRSRNGTSTLICSSQLTNSSKYKRKTLTIYKTIL